MARLDLIDPTKAEGKAAELLGAVKAKMGAVPNMTRAMATSPAVLEGYLALSLFTNYFNLMAATDVDFPPVRR